MNFYIRHFARNHKGSVALLFALSLIPILLAIGAAVDYGRALAVARANGRRGGRRRAGHRLMDRASEPSSRPEPSTTQR
ncbi:pilus assembly protein TadG-related protein, partial [Methyloceanibacter marginalis]|uniref:TadE/TadG family type IV pilus assembly protein n=1 Tax=Methyloceanibacter marginalis TaxID=1774971 RepID=UPI00114D01F5